MSRTSPESVEGSEERQIVNFAEAEDERVPLLREIANTIEEESPFSLNNFKWSTIKTRIPYYIPIIGWLPKYEKRDFIIDLIAGVSISFVLIPQGIALASLANVPPIYGMYTAFFPPLIYAIFGTSKHLSVGPEALLSLMTGQIIRSLNVEESLRPRMAHTIALFSGLFTFTAGLLRLGFLDSILSKPMSAGFVTAVAFVVMIEQLPSLLGLTAHISEEASTIEKFIQVCQNIGTANWIACVLGITALLSLFGYDFLRKKWSNKIFFKYFPFVFVLVIIYIIVTWQLQLDQKGVAILGTVESGFETPFQFDFENAEQVISSSIIISIIGFIESVVCAKKFADKNRYQISDNRELVGLGLANAFGGMFNSYPASGSLSRTSLSDSIGAKSQITYLISCIVVLMTILFLIEQFFYLPKCVMAAVVFFAGFGLLEFHMLFFLVKIRAILDIVLYFMTLIITLAVGIQTGVMVSIGVSLILVVKKVTGPTFFVIGQTNEGKYKPIFEDKWKQHEIDVIEDIVILRFKDSLYYAKLGFVKDRILRVEKFRTVYAHPTDNPNPVPITAIIFDLKHVTEIDASALDLLHEITEHYISNGVRVCFVKLQPQNQKKFKLSGITDLVGNANFFPKIRQAVDAIHSSNAL